MGFDVVGQPRVWAVGGAHVGEKFPQAAVVVFGQQVFGIRPDQKVHVGAGRLLFGAVLQLAQKRAGMRRVDDGQAAHQVGVLVGHVPSHGTAPVVRDQPSQRRVWAFDRSQGHDVLHQVFGAVGGHIGRGAGVLIAAQVGRDASVTAVLGLRKKRQQFIPHKCRLGKSVQKHQHGASHVAADAATQRDAVWQGVCEVLNQGCIQS